VVPISVTEWSRSRTNDPLLTGPIADRDDPDDRPEPDHRLPDREVPKTYYDDVVKIPGYGNAPNRCRPLTPVGFCLEGHPVLGRSSCQTKGCPDHWRDWCEPATVGVIERLAAWREAHHPQAHHIVVSPPSGRYSERALWDARTDAYDVLEDAGVSGGVMIAHPYAATEGAKELYGTAREAGDLPESTGIWRFLRENSNGWEELSRHIEGRPHYHVLAPAMSIDPEAAPEGWIVKRIRSFSRFYRTDSESYRDMAAAAYYVLTHSAAFKGRQATTYFGDLHPSTFDPEEALTATAWRRIQTEAAKAVDRPEEAEGDGPAHGPEECPREECEAAVRPFRELREYLEDGEWVASVRSGVDGRKRWRRLKGMLLWWGEKADRPPPGVQSNETRLLEWLEELGELHTPSPQQVGVLGFA
jgi:hypothetical protein